MQAKARFRCVAEDPTEISFNIGDLIIDVVATKEQGWMQGTVQRTSQRGLFPVNYVDMVPDMATTVSAGASTQPSIGTARPTATVQPLQTAVFQPQGANLFSAEPTQKTTAIQPGNSTAQQGSIDFFSTSVPSQTAPKQTAAPIQNASQNASMPRQGLFDFFASPSVQTKSVPAAAQLASDSTARQGSFDFFSSQPAQNTLSIPASQMQKAPQVEMSAQFGGVSVSKQQAAVTDAIDFFGGAPVQSSMAPTQQTQQLASLDFFSSDASPAIPKRPSQQVLGDAFDTLSLQDSNTTNRFVPITVINQTMPRSTSSQPAIPSRASVANFNSGLQQPALPSRTSLASVNKPAVPSRNSIASLNANDQQKNQPAVESSPLFAVPERRGQRPSTNLQRPKFIPQSEFDRYQDLFMLYDRDGDGFLSGPDVREFMLSSGLDKDTLSRVWTLSDVDRDTRLNPAEFTIAVWMVACHKAKTVFVPHQLDSVYRDWVVSASNSSNNGGGGNSFNPFDNTTATPAPVKDAPQTVKSAINSASAYVAKSVPSDASRTIPRQIAPQPAPPQEQSTADTTAMDLFQFSRTDQGKELVNTTRDFSQSAAGKQATQFAVDHKKEIMAAAQSEEGKAAARAAWQHRDKVAGTAMQGMKLASK